MNGGTSEQVNSESSFRWIALKVGRTDSSSQRSWSTAELSEGVQQANWCAGAAHTHYMRSGALQAWHLCSPMWTTPSQGDHLQASVPRSHCDHHCWLSCQSWCWLAGRGAAKELCHEAASCLTHPSPPLLLPGPLGMSSSHLWLATSAAAVGRWWMGSDCFLSATQQGHPGILPQLLLILCLVSSLHVECAWILKYDSPFGRIYLILHYSNLQTFLFF